MPLSKQQTMLTAQVNQHSKLRRKLIRECEFNVHRWFPRLRCLMSYTSRHTEFGERNHTLQEHGLVTLLFTPCIWPLRLCKKLTPATVRWPAGSDCKATTANRVSTKSCVGAKSARLRAEASSSVRQPLALGGKAFLDTIGKLLAETFSVVIVVDLVERLHNSALIPPLEELLH